MSAKISQLAALAAAGTAANDLLPIADVSASTTKSITLAQLHAAVKVPVSVVHSDGSITPYLPPPTTDSGRGTQLLAAAAASTSGDTILLGPGTFAVVGTNVALPDGVNLVGSGVDITTITGTADETTSGSIVKPGTGSLVDRMTIHAAAVDVDPAYTYQSCIGFTANSSNSPQSAFASATLGTLRLTGKADGLYLWWADSTTPPTVTLEMDDVRAETDFDGYNFRTGTAVLTGVAWTNLTVNSRRIRGTVTGPNNSGEDVYRAFSAASGGTFNLYDSELSATVDTTGDHVSAVDADNGSLVNLYNVRCHAAATVSGTVAAIRSVASSVVTTYPGTSYSSSFTATGGTIVAGSGMLGLTPSAAGLFANPLNVTAAGTAYSLTGSIVAMTFGTTSPAITLDKAGTYLLIGRAVLKYNGATFAANQTATLRYKQGIGNINPTVVPLDVVTTFTGLAAVVAMPAWVVTVAAGTTITFHGGLSAAPGAGSVDVTEASIQAVRLF